MNIEKLIQLLRRWLWLILIGTIVSAAIAFQLSRMQTPIYRATSTVLVNAGDVIPENALSNLNLSVQLSIAYAERLKNYEVLGRAIDNLGLDINPNALKNNTEVEVVRNTHLLKLSVDHFDRTIARDLANEIPLAFAERNTEQQLNRFSTSMTSLEAELDSVETEIANLEAQLATEQAEDFPNNALTALLSDDIVRLRDIESEVLRNLEEIRIAEARSLNSVILDEQAQLPQRPISPRIMVNTLIAAVLGFVLTAALSIFLEDLDTTIKSPGEIEAATGLSTLATIATFSATDDKELKEGIYVARHPRSPISESYRQLRTNIRLSVAHENVRSILITSSHPKEGKSTTAANLAGILAQSGMAIILVDADLRRPSVHNRFNLSNHKGLTDLIADFEQNPLVIQESGIDCLRVITSGPVPPNPAELLGSDRMQEVVKWLEEQADYVIYDSPPVLAVSDSIVLSSLVSTSLITAYSGKTTKHSLAEIVKRLHSVDSHIAGVVLTGCKKKKSSYYSYPSHSAYSADGHTDKETVLVNGQSDQS